MLRHERLPIVFRTDGTTFHVQRFFDGNGTLIMVARHGFDRSESS
jgi:hypothetical protein